MKNVPYKIILKMGLLLIASFAGASVTYADTSTLPLGGVEDTALYHVTRFQVDGTQNRTGGLVNWQGSGWYGGDTNRFAFKTEGEMQNGHVERSEVWGLYSRNISTFWDLQGGIRQDFDPRSTTYLAVGVQGLAPYFFETDAHAFVSSRGDVSARIEQSIDVLISQRLILQPHIKVDMSAQDVPELNLGSGISKVEVGSQVRYEITRKFAPYLDLVYERSVGNTERLIRAGGGNPGSLTLRAGIRFWF